MSVCCYLGLHGTHGSCQVTGEEIQTEPTTIHTTPKKKRKRKRNTRSSATRTIQERAWYNNSIAVFCHIYGAGSKPTGLSTAPLSSYHIYRERLRLNGYGCTPPRSHVVGVRDQQQCSHVLSALTKWMSLTRLGDNQYAKKKTWAGSSRTRPPYYRYVVRGTYFGELIFFCSFMQKKNAKKNAKKSRQIVYGRLLFVSYGDFFPIILVHKYKKKKKKEQCLAPITMIPSSVNSSLRPPSTRNKKKKKKNPSTTSSFFSCFLVLYRLP